jgi:hypothetical protein
MQHTSKHVLDFCSPTERCHGTIPSARKIDRAGVNNFGQDVEGVKLENCSKNLKRAKQGNKQHFG